MLPVQIAEVTSDATIRADKDVYAAYSIIKEGDKLSKIDWKIVSFTTEEASGEGSNNGHAKHLIDGNVETFWHSRWQGGSDPLPYEIRYRYESSGQNSSDRVIATWARK